MVPIARRLHDMGFRLLASEGTARHLQNRGIPCERIFKVNEGRPHVGDEILNHRIHLVINTPLGRESFFDDRTVRRVAMMHSVPCITTLTGASATVSAIRALRTQALDVRALQDAHGKKPSRLTRRPALASVANGTGGFVTLYGGKLDDWLIGGGQTGDILEGGLGADKLEGDGDVSLARWAAQQQEDVFERTFERALEVR